MIWLVAPVIAHHVDSTAWITVPRELLHPGFQQAAVRGRNLTHILTHAHHGMNQDHEQSITRQDEKYEHA